MQLLTESCNLQAPLQVSALASTAGTACAHRLSHIHPLPSTLPKHWPLFCLSVPVDVLVVLLAAPMGTLPLLRVLEVLPSCHQISQTLYSLWPTLINLFWLNMSTLHGMCLDLCRMHVALEDKQEWRWEFAGRGKRLVTACEAKELQD